MTWKRCKIGGKVVLITNKKSHGFRLILKSVTFNDLERRNGRVICVKPISPSSVAFGALHKSGGRYTDTFCKLKCFPKNLVLAVYHLAIFAWNHH